MSAIRILPENLANQIAAGEVVERPASVVKELLENAVDAGARNITVQVEGNATALIRIIDDGGGMDGDDLLLCLERHATSKLRDQAGLIAIKTMGFRGEALPSIASVSRLRIISRPRGAELGGRIEVSFGTVRQVLEAGAAYGTTIEVRDLFGNVPARRKFMKSARTELYHLEECVKNCALAFPAMGMHYQVDGRTVLQWPAGVDDAAARIRRLLAPAGGTLIIVGREEGGGNQPAEQPAEQPTEQVAKQPTEQPAGIEVYGLLPLPEETSATGARLRLFVNGRPVRDRMISHAVGEGLRNHLARGRQPAGVLFIRLDPALVDVNVHPTKQEIRFQQTNRVHDAVREAVAAAVAAHEKVRQRELFGGGRPPLPASESTESYSAAPVSPSDSAKPAKPQARPTRDTLWSAPGLAVGSGVSESGVSRVGSGARESGDSGPGAGASESVDPGIGVGESGDLRPGTGASGAGDSGLGVGVSGRDDGGLLARGVAESPGFKGGVGPDQSATCGLASSGWAAAAPDLRPRLLGQVLHSYILCESGGALLAVDQHAAHERLLFERLRRQYGERGLARQGLLFPLVLEFTAAEAAVAERRGEEISRLGLELTPFGGHSYLVKAVPALLAKSAPAEVVAGVLAAFLENDGPKRSEATLEAVLAGMACKAAIKAGQALEPAEMERLLADMAAADLFSRCPHGRPVVRRFSPEEMKKWFHR